MNIRIYETPGLDIDTVTEMLLQADRQANFDPVSQWIMSAGEIEEEVSDIKQSMNYRYRDIYVKWIGVDAVISWLTSNQMLFEVMSFELLHEEQEALEQRFPRKIRNNEKFLLN